MRGKDDTGGSGGSDSRITPAHAGKSYVHLAAAWARGDHPRPCGEKLLWRSRCVPVPGSPPPMRGKVALIALSGDAAGITPAHAGKSVYVYVWKSRALDHPRPCGEKAAAVLAGGIPKGSPPPMRGKGTCG